MTEETKCCTGNNCNCKCSKDSLMQYAKLVYCNDKNCMFNKQISERYVPDRGKGYKPFSDDYFDGICTRAELALRPQDMIVDNGKRRRKDTICTMKVDKKFSHGRLLYPDEIHSFVKDEPVDPTSAFHG